MKHKLIYEEQAEIAKTYNLEYEIRDDTALHVCETDDEPTIIVLAFNDGTIIQRWICSKDKDDKFHSKIIFKNESLERKIKEPCGNKVTLAECLCKCDPNNIECYQCTKDLI